MLTIQPFMPSDIFSLDLTNLDKNTENYTVDYYLHYLLNFSDDCFVSASATPIANNDFLYDRSVLGYLIGKHEINDKEEFHGHVTALSIAPDARMSGVGRSLMHLLAVNGRKCNAKFIDLYVRLSNEPAINFYKKLGYEINEKIPEYYTGDADNEDAYDMRLSLE